ncbi:hypothetical protein Q672_17995 [Marinobacter sp. EVN1]|uniref:FRG domain-containing protein n=1 Tax=Marinobacter sp. EVN1 TaxID=1397532 RepID=UPI0003B87B60|nr:FRG domain-containing protein [Marinobacter sp. EVN1]ERS84825.1 hypothetical protein Q672_17995 [Marinobacter sp. EVN1]
MINSWSGYKEWVSQTIASGNHFYYRGQLNPTWKLQTTFHRQAERTYVPLQHYLDHILPEVSYHVSAHQNEDLNLFDEAQFGNLLARLQHHGFPTPLLDWTLSPYIAAFFAYKNVDPKAPQTQSVTVYMFDFQQWAATFQQPMNLRAEVNFVSAFRPFAKGNPRMHRQMAVTTVTNVSDMEQYLLQQGNAAQKTFLYKALLPVSERRLVMNELNLMGINAMTMFPDFDGICAAMKEMFFNDLDVNPLVPPPPAPGGYGA